MHTPPDSYHSQTLLEPRRRPLPPKPRRVRWVVGMGLVLLLLLLILVVRPLLAQQAPGLTFSQTGTNQFQITITNAVPGETYEIHRRAVFHDEYPWQLYLVGTNSSQTNFTAFMGADIYGFFRAQEGTDADGDGILDWFDGNPTNASISTLFITIDNPTTGAVIE